jgi:hypothetical protein
MTKPGSGAGSAGAPADFQYENYERLSQNPQMNRMPTTDQEWVMFIHELNKMVRNESDGFIPTFTGFSSDPSNPFVWWHRFGQIVQLEFVFGTGTSNTNTFIITNLPTEITPYTDTTVLCRGLVDNGSAVGGAGSAEIKANGTIEFYDLDHYNSSLGGGGWTNSGSKGFNTNVAHPTDIPVVLYMLRKPNKT